ncbi:MAG: CoA transferase, partial [Gammaproteobacteria bacterium]
ERPTGEYIRQLYPLQKGMSTCYTSTNVNQRIAELDIKDPAHLAVVQRLAAEVDILVENFRPNVGARIGLGYEALRQTNPLLIYGSSTGWGDVGPMRDRAALDPHIQAFTGFGSLNGAPNGTPEMARYIHMDPSAATFFTGMVLLGLIERKRFGQGSWVKTSHLASGIAQQMSRAAEGLSTGAPVQRLGSASSASAPNQCFRALDHEYIAVACDNQLQWQGFTRAIRQTELVDDPRFATNVDRVTHREALTEIVGSAIAEKPSRWWIIQFQREGVPHGLSLSFDSLLNHQQIVANDLLVETEPPHMGTMNIGGLPWQFSETPAHIDKRIAIPGEHTDEVMQHGFDPVDDQIAAITDSQLTLPLQGLKVIDTTQGNSGPFLGLLLAEAGAEVIKVEPPGGDWARQLAPLTATGNSAVFEAYNRNKDGVVLDLDDAKGQADLRVLAGEAAVLLEDWGPGVAARRNLDYQTLAKDIPGLVFLSLTPFGENGPLRDQPGSELVIQAMTGYLRALGTLGDAPVRVGADIVAACSGAMAFVSVLAALYHRENTGAGQRVAVSELGTMMAIRTHQWAGMTNPDEWLGNSYCTNETDGPHYGYHTKDRAIFMTPSTGLKQDEFFDMLREFGMYEEFSNKPVLMKNWWHSFGIGFEARHAQPLWDKYLSNFTAVEVLEILSKYVVWAVEFSDLLELMDHPQVEALNIVHRHGEQRYVRAPWTTPWGLPDIKPAPRL